MQFSLYLALHKILDSDVMRSEACMKS